MRGAEGLEHPLCVPSAPLPRSSLLQRRSGTGTALPLHQRGVLSRSCGPFSGSRRCRDIFWELSLKLEDRVTGKGRFDRAKALQPPPSPSALSSPSLEDGIETF